MKVEKLAREANNLGYLIGLLYKMLKAKEFGVSVEEIEIPTRSVESREDTSYTLVVDPQGASLSGTTACVDKDSERIASVIANINIPLYTILKE